MLTRLDISNFALIENVNLNFKEGFSVITGETGAGKSILLKALNLLLGDRADYSVLNKSEKKCTIEAEFNVENIINSDFFEEYNIDFESQTIVRREFTTSGKSRIFINDTPTTLSTLKLLGEQLIKIHSQHQTLQLFDNKFQIDVVDTFCKQSDTVTTYQKKFNQFILLKKELLQLKIAESNNRKEMDYVSFLITELDEINLDNINVSDLESEHIKIQNWSTIKSSLENALSVFETSETSPIEGIDKLLISIHTLKDIDPAYNELILRLNSSKIELQDIQAEIEAKTDQDDLDEEKSILIQEKIEAINSLSFKHNVDSINELIEIKTNLENQLKGFSSTEEDILKTEKEIAKLEIELTSLAEKIHSNRLKNKPKLESEINNNLEQLAMPNAQIKIDIQKSKGLTINGISELQFLFKTNLGGDFLTIKKTASGGELSRLMLSILGIIANLKSLPTMIFDEIDTGVSGEVAAKMALMFKKLGQKSQIISITHLPQIAGKGNLHYHVFKSDDKNITRTKVTLLSNEERIMELAKMTSGEKITESAIANAKQLLTNE
jgi:DNA repair protein RecN (Recombination protein N)